MLTPRVEGHWVPRWHHSVFLILLRGTWYNSHFTDEETEAEKLKNLSVATQPVKGGGWHGRLWAATLRQRPSQSLGRV